MNSIWDLETSGQQGSAGGVGLTTAEMMDPDMLALNGFGGDPNWIVDAGQDYPRLTWQGTEGHPIAEPVIDWLSGRGTEEDPYCINQSDQLIMISKASIFWDKHLLLCENIDLDPNLPGRYIFNQALIPNFSGIFEGDGHLISYLTIRGNSPLGLFGQLALGAEIRNLGLVNVIIKGTHMAGGLVGYSSGIVENSYCTGLVAGGYWAVGGLVGLNFGDILNSYTNCSVSGTECVGGLTGDNYSMIMNSYSVGPVSGTFVGGLTCGGYYTVSSSFWDTETSGVPAWDGSMGLTTAEMQDINTYLDAGWDFDTIWSICEGQDYPRLQWENLACSE